MPIQHVFTSPKADDPDATLIRPSDWNSAHAYTMQDAIAAGTQTASSGTVVFSNSNGMSFGLNGSVLTGTVKTDYLTTAMASNRGSDFVQAAAAFAGTSASGTIASNGISISIGPYLTTGMASNRGSDFVQATAAFAGTSASGTIASNGISISIGPYLTTAMQSNAATISNLRVSGGTTSNLLSAITFGNANGISFGLNASTMTASHNAITTARASNDAIGLNTAQTNVTWTVNSSGLSFNAAGYAGTGTSATNASVTMNSNGLAISVAAPGGGGVTPVASASNGSFSFTTLGFSNANNVTFGTSAGSIITASVAAPGAAAENNWVHLLGANTAGNTTASGSTIGYSGVNVTLSGANGSQIVISGPASSSWQGTNGISLSTNGSTVSVMGHTLSAWEVFPNGNNTTFSSLGQNSLYLQKLRPIDNLAVNAFERRASGSFVSSTNSQVVVHTIKYGLYSRDNATRVTSCGSSQIVISASYNSNTAMGFTISQDAGSYTTTSGGTAIASLMTGYKHMYLPFVTTMSVGQEYWFAMHVSSATTVGTSPLRLAFKEMTNINNLTIGKIYASTIIASNTSHVGDYHQGVYSATTAALPSSIADNQITNAVSQARMYLQVE